MSPPSAHNSRRLFPPFNPEKKASTHLLALLSLARHQSATEDQGGRKKCLALKVSGQASLVQRTAVPPRRARHTKSKATQKSCLYNGHYLSFGSPFYVWLSYLRAGRENYIRERKFIGARRPRLLLLLLPRDYFLPFLTVRCYFVCAGHSARFGCTSSECSEKLW